MISKKELEVGEYYLCFSDRDQCEQQARWDGKQFAYWNYSFGWFIDKIEHPTDCERFASFTPIRKLKSDEILKEIEV
jgi:hypothetical protein